MIELEITETHKKVLKILSIPENDFRFLPREVYASGKFSNYAFELVNEGYLTGEVVERDNRLHYLLKLTEKGKKAIGK